VKTIVEELVARGSWVGGSTGHLALFAIDTGASKNNAAQFTGHDADPAKAGIFTCTYTNP